MVLFDKRLDVGNLVVNFLADLGEGDEAFVPPCLGGGGDFHHTDEIELSRYFPKNVFCGR